MSEANTSCVGGRVAVTTWTTGQVNRFTLSMSAHTSVIKVLLIEKDVMQPDDHIYVDEYTPVEKVIF